MSLFSRPGPRFIAEAGAIVLATVVTGFAHLVWWQIGVCVGAVVVISVAIESRFGGDAAPVRTAPVAPPEPIEEVPQVRVIEERPIAELVPPTPARAIVSEPEPEPVPEPEPEPVPEPEPEPVALAVAVRVSGPPFNVWELERALQASGAADDEKTFLLHYLRDYAGSDGTLPPEFEDLVRESFGALL